MGEHPIDGVCGYGSVRHDTYSIYDSGDSFAFVCRGFDSLESVSAFGGGVHAFFFRGRPPSLPFSWLDLVFASLLEWPRMWPAVTLRLLQMGHFMGVIITIGWFTASEKQPNDCRLFVISWA